MAFLGGRWRVRGCCDLQTFKLQTSDSAASEKGKWEETQQKWLLSNHGEKKKRIKDSYLKIIFQTAKKKQSSTPRGFWCHNANFWWINGEKSDDEEEIRKKQTLSWIGIFMDSLALTCESFGSRSCCFGCSILRLHESSQDELAL